MLAFPGYKVIQETKAHLVTQESQETLGLGPKDRLDVLDTKVTESV